MNFFHYSDKPFTLDRSRKYEVANEIGKPGGLWLSEDDDWAEWCQGNSFGLDRLACKTQINLNQDSNRILFLSGLDGIRRFTKDYGKPAPRDRLEFQMVRSEIDWEKVKQYHAGIVIVPYCYEARLSFFWYYGWDCASACIWDLGVVL